MNHHPGLYIIPTEHKGLGVFTNAPIQTNDVIEICPIVVIPKKQIEWIDKTIIYEYYFKWNNPVGSACIALGYGSIYNHSFRPNAEVISDLEHNSITIKCIKPIAPGEEICIDYCGGEQNRDQLWFEPID